MKRRKEGIKANYNLVQEFKDFVIYSEVVL